MFNSCPLCVLIAEIVGGSRLVARLGETETARAVERCLNRVDLAVSSSGGQIVARDRSAIIATFEQCNDGVIAAFEAMDRVRKLPPASGVLMQVRIGVHYGEAENGVGKGVNGARLVLQACNADQSLASAPVIDELNPAVRKFVSAEAYDSPLDTLPWPIFMIGAQNTTTVSPSLVQSSRPRLHLEPSSPLTSLKPPPALQPDARPVFSPRMQLKHQQNTLVVDGKRPVILLGRELGNDIVIIDPRASRQHARVERRREGFMLIDESTNGCFVAIEGQEEQCLKGTALPLTGSGRFGCGFSPQEFEEDLVFFEFI
ncbi:MAG: FHA domain-containing protein [Betaproteobacteria bacterium]|nr:FHA domain-containing protein [Betaproteobacteria bacterium]